VAGPPKHTRVWATSDGNAPRALGVALVASALSLCLLGECQVARDSRALGNILGEIIAVLRDAGTQWIVFLCAGMYFFTFTVLRERLGGGAGGGEDRRWRVEDGATGPRASGGRRLENRASTARSHWNLAPQWLREPAFWLTGLMVLVAVKSTQALTLLGGALIGQGAAFWVQGPRSKVQGLKSGPRTVIGVLIVLLVAGAVWQTETGQVFEYRGRARWSGPWDSPNTFGVLMGAGAVLALGWVLRAWRMGNGKWQISNLLRWLFTTLLVAAAGAMGVGLVKSYSRGAWVAVLVGLAYLAWQSRRSRGWQMANGKLWGMAAVIALLVIGFWSLRQAEGAIARRAYSIANANDFSWRNRVAAYEGALAMLADKPWLGFGWNQPERVYTSLYCPAKVDESMAIQLNDYFILGTTLGVPALVCFAMYVGLSLNPKSTAQRLKPGESKTTDFRLKTLDLAAVCRAGAVVLAVGFWFDGGLFKLATGATFWTLLELGRE